MSGAQRQILVLTSILLIVLALVTPARSSAQTFSDVPANYWAYTFIERFAARGITSGCGNGQYCPEDSVTRAQMAVFLERGMKGAGFVPPPATGALFGDVAANDFAAAFIEQLFQDGITGGCGNGDYCPDNNVTRAQMAVFLLRAMYGADYAPPPATGVFNDVPLGSFADAWIEQLAVEQITSGCGGGGFCPNDSVTRAQMAVFIVRALLEPPVLTSIQLSQTSLTLDRWGDTALINTMALDQDGFEVPGASITWLSSDASVAAVDNMGNVSTWLGGDVMLTVEASKDGVTVNDTVSVNVAIQRNSNCTVPTELPVQGPVAPPSQWLARNASTVALPDTTYMGPMHMGIPLVLDADRDGDTDLLTLTNTPEGQGIGIPIDTAHAIWVNDGNGVFSDGTEAILGGNDIPWSAPRSVKYEDFDGDGFRDIVVFQQGWEFGSCAEVDGCPGGPNLLFLPQPFGLADSAPTRLDPYDLNGFSHSGGVGDVDCDGDIDIVEANWGGPGRAAVHHIQLNSGAGTFLANPSLLPNELMGDVSIAATAVCDLDLDGDPDLINSFPDTASPYVPDGFSADFGIRISVNDGFGEFRMLNEDVLPPLFPYDQLDCGDLDLNGYPDIVMATKALMNQGDMTFVSDSSIQYTTSRSGVGIIDLNNDGWPDLAPTDEYVFWNNGNASFNSALVPSACCSHQPTIADFNMDGWPDIYVHRAKQPGVSNILYLNIPANAPVKRVFATSSQYTADLGGLTGADAICQQHASDAGLPGSYVAYLSDSNIDALSRLSHGEFRRAGDDAVVAPSKFELGRAEPTNPVANDENGTAITTNERVRTGTDWNGYRHQGTGIGFCSDWTRATDEVPGLAAHGIAWAGGTDWAYQEGAESNCSEPQRLYCFQQ